MKKKSVFLDENTNLEIEEFLRTHHTLYVPVGATEQHGPHAAIGTDVFIPREIARRLCEKKGNALVAPSLAYTLSYPHKGFTSEFSLSIETFMAMVKELALSFAKAGFKRIVFLNGHYDNTYALAYACAQAAETMPEGARAFPFNYYDGLTAEEFALMTEDGKGLRGRRRISMLLAINLIWPIWKRPMPSFRFPRDHHRSPPAQRSFSPGSATDDRVGTWGDASKGTGKR